MADISFFHYLNSLAGQSSGFDFIVVLVGQYVPYVLGFLPFLLFRKQGWSKETRSHVGFIYAYAIIARFVVTPIIRYFIISPRPFLTPGVRQLIFNETSSSFPSGHAVFFFALATGLWFYDRRLGLIAGIVALLVSTARVIAGVHWPVDIVGGFVVGVGVTWICEVLRKRYLLGASL
ncbi:MAG: hypothetical protein A3C11_01770 [Candidatus Sungbacteria bacterium RIFCSPHIGHO2_02_FULL_49_12]|uniref:Phosphatidic acid phosphatase type 2/haloperoxidase domain-containing protein n=1 Tax=Candidatus Sungbacteria bacterium RIFCSPHIGHO2_02_FULL_49_12 TaxID=1802271 RepID=A0A1G2KPN2_9BACT|nr:MAG: hypothetical protein A3C11_01770 [Candidatus Sungbacteria bacterium RIFCSPHIGHO2_02_FULL_49_12]